jgi:hypothetical protein
MKTTQFCTRQNNKAALTRPSMRTLTVTHLTRWLALALASVLSACSSSTTPDVADGADTGASSDAEGDSSDTSTDSGVVTSAIGRACMGELVGGTPMQGDCLDGEICLPEQFGFINGYCTSDCGQDPCAAGSTCIPVGGPTRLCLKNCRTNADCRVGEGYRCQMAGAGRMVCVPGGGPTGLRDGQACYSTTPGPHQLPALEHRTFATPNVSLSRERVDTRLQAEGNVVINPVNGAIATSYIAVDRNSVFMGVSTRFADDTVQRAGAVRDPSLQTTSDPVLAYTADGRLHMVFLGYNVTGQGQPTGMRLRYTTSADDGRTWQPAVGIEPNAFCATGCDKPWIVIGPTPRRFIMNNDGGVIDSGASDADASADMDGAFDSGLDGASVDSGVLDSGGPVRDGTSIYVGIMQQSGGTVRLFVLRSDDGGRSWTAPMQFAMGGGNRPGAVAPNLLTPAIGADATVHMTYAGIGGSRFGDMANRVYYRASTDGGETWGEQRIVSRATDTPVYGQPVVVVDGARLHVAYVNGTTSGHWDVILATSADGGASWTHRKVNDEPDSCATHAFPWIVADSARGRVHAMWLENRFGDGAVAYAACPSDPAMPCGTNELIGDGTFTFETSREPDKWHGDYLGFVQARDGTLWSGWSDTRSGTPAMYLARGTPR